MDLVTIFGQAGGLLIAVMALLWLVSLVLRNSGIVDIFWGVGFVLLTSAYITLGDVFLLGRTVLILCLVTLWGLRLALHIMVRSWGHGEDYRYAQWREEAGASWWWWSFFKVFLLQGVIMWVISTPLLVASVSDAPLSWLDLLGIGVWTFGFIFEAGGDWQLMQFKSDPNNKGKLMTSGLWRYTRHPNYFGDAVQWWGFWIIACAAGGFWTVYSPVLMTYLLLRVSGVAMLERSLKQVKPGYEDYVSRTNAFVPWFPREQ